jgi:hypothetical protein
VNKAFALLLPLFLTACGGGNNPSPPPSPSSGWTFEYSSNVSNPCSDFDFPSRDGAHYCVNGAVKPKAGQTITMSFTISGSGTLAVVDPNDTLPATIHLFMQRAGDDLSCIGQFQQYRYWAARTVLAGPNTYTVTAPVTPSQWTDCYGKPGSDLPAQFQAVLNNLSGVGYTFGGKSFAGHGVYATGGSVHFKLNTYQSQ